MIVKTRVEFEQSQWHYIIEYKCTDDKDAYTSSICLRCISSNNILPKFYLVITTLVNDYVKCFAINCDQWVIYCVIDITENILKPWAIDS